MLIPKLGVIGEIQVRTGIHAIHSIRKTYPTKKAVFSVSFFWCYFLLSLSCFFPPVMVPRPLYPSIAFYNMCIVALVHSHLFLIFSKLFFNAMLTNYHGNKLSKLITYFMKDERKQVIDRAGSGALKGFFFLFFFVFCRLLIFFLSFRLCGYGLGIRESGI